MSKHIKPQFYRLAEIVGDPKKGVKGLIPLSRSSWLKGVKEGEYPAPVKLGSRAVAWRAKDIENWMDNLL